MARANRALRTGDAKARDAVGQRLDETLFLEAGAGSGKTSCLVDRFLALVEAGVPADAIAAITFTEKAAAELADRLRQALQKEAQTSEHCRTALEVLDRAAVCTLHAFAQRILVAHPIEAGLPPRLAVVDEITSQLAFQRRWEAFVDRLLDDPALERPLRLLIACGAGLGQLRDVALAFGDNWDLVAERGGAGGDPPEVEVEALCAELDALVAEAESCTTSDDGMHQRLGQIADYAAELRDATDEEARLELLRRTAPSFNVGRTGARGNWPKGNLDALRDRIRTVGDGRVAIAQEVIRACVARMAEELARFTLAAADERRAEGRLEFHDLLVLARAVLRHPSHGPTVRAALRGRYQRLLLDEFQDTDPIQVELAVLIASVDPEAGRRPWEETEVEPGRLFFVGDPKQSIYRFRRADIGVFLAARDALAGDPLQLTTNFRTGPAIVEWVNRVFGTVIQEQPGSQPAYLPLEPYRGSAPSGPPVAFAGAHRHPAGLRADDLREREAATVASAARRVVAEGWQVAEGPPGDERWRPARWADISILLPARTSLPALERALEEQAVPYRAETSSLVYGTREVRDLLAVARAIDDPTDELSLVTALRSPAFGCGDDDLYTWRIEHRGRWDHQAPLSDSVPPEHPVAQAMAWLGDIHRRRNWLSPSQVLDLIVRDRRLMQMAFVQRRPRDLLRRLRFVIDQARAWQGSGGGSLRDYLTWVRLQSMESSRVVETVLPETDDESVRIMTIHGAKGLEFPVTVLSGMTTQLRGRRAGVKVLFPPDGGWAIRLGKGITTAEFEAYVPIDEQLDQDERLRLLYVAATRARDHLVVSVHRKEPSSSGSTALPTSAEVFWDNGYHDDLVTLLPDEALPALGHEQVAGVSLTALPERAVWEAERERAVVAGLRPLALSATRAAERLAELAAGDPGIAKEPRDLDLPPWQKGRYGTAVGRAVHAVLQNIDLFTGEGLPAAAAAQAAAEGVLGREAVIEALARSALASPIVQAAAALPHWRELYVGIPLGGLVLEGYIDLAWRTDDGLVVADYKTDAWRTDAELDTKVVRYRPQLAAYALALSRATGEPVVRAVIVFLSDRTAVEREVADLPSAIAEVLGMAQGVRTPTA